MRILHTADWHLADRLKHIDRTADIERAVERIAAICEDAAVDVLLIAGDLFSELAKPDSLRRSVSHLSGLFRPFLLGGGTIVALTGNHDNDIYCETLRRAFQLAAPNQSRPGDILPNGRFYLATHPVHFRLVDRGGLDVQFACMPYPTAARYRIGETQYRNFDQRNQLLKSAYITSLKRIRRQLQPNVPGVLATHVNILKSASPGVFRLGCGEDIHITDPVTTSGWNYVALGHLHGPLKVNGLANVRYAGSIERLDLGERNQNKGVVLIDIHGSDEPANTSFLPLSATPFYDVRIQDPAFELPTLTDRYPDAKEALVRCHISYCPGKDDLYRILADVTRIFPRCYERTWSAMNAASPQRASGSRKPNDSIAGQRNAVDIRGSETDSSMELGDDIAQVILGYLQTELAADPDRELLLSMAKQLLGEID